MGIENGLHIVFSPRSTTNTFLNGSVDDIHKRLSMDEEPKANIIDNLSPRIAFIAKALTRNSDVQQSLNREKNVAVSLINYLECEKSKGRFRIPKTDEDLRASQIYLSLFSGAKENSFENQNKHYETLIKILQNHIDKQISPVLYKLEHPDLPEIEHLNEKITSLNYKIEKQAVTLAPIRDFTRPMLEAYLNGIRTVEDYQNHEIYQGLTPQQRKAVRRMIRKKPSYKVYIERNCTLILQTFESLSRLGADFDRHIPYVHIYNRHGQSLLSPSLSVEDLNSAFSKLERIHEWFMIFCDKCGIPDSLQRDILNKWYDIVKNFEKDEEVVSKSVQTFFEALRSNAEEESDYSDGDKNLMSKLARCMATISQKLYSDPGVCVGQTTRPDGHASAYADIPSRKSIELKFDDKSGVEVVVTIEKEVNQHMKGVGGKQEFDEFPNVRLKLINTMSSNLLHFDHWNSDYRLKIGVERLTNSIGLPTIPNQIHKKIIKPLTAAGLMIEHIYSY